MGDSTVVCYPNPECVSKQFRLALSQVNGRPGDPRFAVHDLAQPGMGAFDFYFLAAEIARVRPDLVVIPFNPATMSNLWRRRFSRPELAGFIPFAGLGEALALPLHWIGLTTDRLLFYMGIVHGGGFSTWLDIVRHQSRLAPALTAMEQWGGDAMERYRAGRNSADLVRRIYPKRKRYRAAFLAEQYGAILSDVSPDHPVLQMLAATLDVLDEAGVPVLVYATPLNVEHMRTEGVIGDGGLGRSMHTVESLVHTHGADYLDLHALLPDKGFRDAPGHFSTLADGGFDGTGRVAWWLAERVRAMARARLGGPLDG
jgi:hypothetical protein